MPQEYLTIPVFELYLFGCADFEADAAAFLSRARRERLSSSDLISPYHGFCFLLKKNQQNLSQKTGVGLIAFTVRGSPAHPYRM